MKILSKIVGITSYIPLKIRHKCVCTMKVLLEDSSDVVFTEKGYDYGSPKFGYYCPNCNALVELDYSANEKIRTKITKAGFNLEQYTKTVDGINRYFESNIIPSKQREEMINKMRVRLINENLYYLPHPNEIIKLSRKYNI